MDVSSCSICGNTNIVLGVCKVCVNGKDREIAYNAYCPSCNFTGRSYRTKVKALDKWNKLCEQTKNMTKDIER
jgi:hypothetical protein